MRRGHSVTLDVVSDLTVAVDQPTVTEGVAVSAGQRERSHRKAPGEVTVNAGGSFSFGDLTSAGYGLKEYTVTAE